MLTVPNLISFTRLLGVPLFLYLFLATDATGWAVVVLAVGGLSDWVDGFAARRLKQVSRLGELLDPLADRLYILATLFALTFKDVVPWWFTIALLAREAVMVLCLVVLRRPRPRPAAGALRRQDRHRSCCSSRFPMLLLAKFSDAATLVGAAERLGAGLVGHRPVLGRRRLLLIQAAIHVRAGRLQASDAS